MRPAPAPRTTNGHAPHANGHERRDELEYYIAIARQLRARYRRSLCCLTVASIARVLVKLENQGRIDVEALRADLDRRDMGEILRLLGGDTRLGASLRRAS
jgi:hypothetical protein